MCDLYLLYLQGADVLNLVIAGLQSNHTYIYKVGVKLLYAGFETCFGWGPRHQRCWDPIAKHISNPDIAWKPF